MMFRQVMQHLVAPLCILLGIVAFNNSASAQGVTPTLIFDLYKKAVVNLAVSFIDKSGNPNCEIGTGFIISNNGYVLTARHLIEDDKGNISKSMQIFASVGTPILLQNNPGTTELCSPISTVRGLQVVELSQTQDVALLKMPGDSTYDYVPACKQTAVLIGSEVLKIGYPKGTYAAPQKGTIAALDGPQGMWQVDLNVVDGDSGSPIFNESGRLIGLASASLKDNPLLAWIIPLQYFQSLYGVANVPLIDCSTSTGILELSSCDPILVPHDIDFTLAEHASIKETYQEYTNTVQAAAGKVILDYSWVPNSVNNARGPSFYISQDGLSLSMRATVTSGPLFDRYRGWIHGTLFTKEIPKGCGQRQ